MGTQEKQVPNSKYGVTMGEIFKLRVTQSQKQSLYSASAEVGAGTASDFYREYLVYSAEQLTKLQAGVISSDEFGASVANFVQEYMSATIAHPEPPDET